MIGGWDLPPFISFFFYLISLISSLQNTIVLVYVKPFGGDVVSCRFYDVMREYAPAMYGIFWNKSCRRVLCPHSSKNTYTNTHKISNQTGMHTANANHKSHDSNFHYKLCYRCCQGTTPYRSIICYWLWLP